MNIHHAARMYCVTQILLKSVKLMFLRYFNFYKKVDVTLEKNFSGMISGNWEVQIPKKDQQGHLH